MVTELNEDQVLEAMDSAACDWSSIAKSISALYADGKNAEADVLVETAEAKLKEAESLNDLLLVYQAKAKNGGKPAKFERWAEQVQHLLGNDWESKALFEQAGFESGLSDEEAFRRLILLRSLDKGTVCWDKTWGTGVIGDIDYFYKRVEINFKRKRGHQLALSYAAEKLLLLDEDHLFYWRHKKPEELDKKIKKEPGEIVKMAVRSFGPMSAIQVQERLVPEVIEEKKWKSFWDAAKKQLRSDQSVMLPSKRTDMIRIVSVSDDVPDDLNGMIKERNLDVLAHLFEEYADEIGSGGVTDHQRKILQDRLAFVVKGAWPRQLTVLARAKIAAVSLGVDDESKPELAAVEKFFDEGTFKKTLKKLSAKNSGQFLRYLSSHDKERLDLLLSDLIATLDITSINEVITYMFEQGEEKKVAEVFRAAVETRKPGIVILSWLSRNMEKVGAWGLGPMHTILNFMIDEIEKDFSGDNLKAQNQLKERFCKSDWMASALSQLDSAQREALTMRVRNSSGWSTLDKQSQLATIVKLYTELEELVSGASRAETVVKTKGPMTSFRSYDERKEQLQRIINYEIPKVAKDIAQAREHGDLRENFEYKAAKDQQALLFRRRDEIGEQLATVTPSDFKDLPSDKAGLATTVELTFGDGQVETYHLLGEWDSDPTKGIISSNSRMAQMLTGHKEGESLMVPTESGEATATITSVKPLSIEIQNWVEGK